MILRVLPGCKIDISNVVKTMVGRSGPKIFEIQALVKLWINMSTLVFMEN